MHAFEFDFFSPTQQSTFEARRIPASHRLVVTVCSFACCGCARRLQASLRFYALDSFRILAVKSRAVKWPQSARCFCLAVLALRWLLWGLSLVAASRGRSPVAVCGLLTAVVSPVAEHRL